MDYRRTAHQEHDGDTLRPASTSIAPPLPQSPPRLVPLELRWARRIWLIGTAVSVLGALITLAATGADMVSLVMLTVTLLQGAVAIPAAIRLCSGARWAQVVLIVLAALSMGSLYQTFEAQAWPSLALNLLLAATLSLLLTPTSKAFFRVARAHTPTS